MKRKIFLRILGVTALSVIILFVAGIVITYANGRNLIRERLITETKLVAGLLDEEADYSAFEGYYNNDELRVTIIDATSGEVLFESDTNSELEENHLDREEVRNALSDTPQPVERYSETFRCEMTYYALKSEFADGRAIVVRLAVRSSEVASYFWTALPFLVLSLAVAIIVALGLANKLSHTISEKITEVGDSLKSLNAGQYKPLQTDTTEPEFYTLFNEINELNESTHGYIRREKGEREKLDAVLSNVAQGIVALNEKNEIVFVNGSALRLFGGKESDEGKSLVFLIEDSRLCGQIAAHMGEGDFAFEYEYDEKTLSVAGKKATGEAIEKTVSYILIFTDVTGEKEIIRQKSEFFANASHELKTPVTVMRGLTELLLQKENADEQEKKRLERIHKESLRLSSLISDMLKLSKLERSEEDERTEVDLREVTGEVLSELSAEMQAKNLSVTLTGEGKLLADPKKMFELIQNLCSNAVNYNKQDGWIKVSIEETSGGLTLRVSDSGIGIEKEHLPRLCERFYRVDKSRSKKTGGTGLGLAIVKHICALYEAQLSIESEIGCGTQVTVLFKKGSVSTLG